MQSKRLAIQKKKLAIQKNLGKKPVTTSKDSASNHAIYEPPVE
jgi:hypothetical protein